MVKERIQLTFTGDSSKLTTAVNKVTSSLKGVKVSQSKVNVATKNFGQKLKTTGTRMQDISRKSQGLIGRYIVLAGVLGGLAGFFKRSLAVSEDFNQSVFQTAALWTSFSKKLGKVPIAKVYGDALKASQKLNQKFIDINGETLATITQMQAMNREFSKFGIQLSSTNSKQLDAFITLSNTIAILTAGMPNQNIQFGQELRAVFEGLARQGATLSLILRRKLGPEWRIIIDRWRTDGVLVEKLANQFKGVNAASLDLENTWLLVRTTFVSMFDTILRLGFAETFINIISFMQQLNIALVRNRDVLVQAVEQGWLRFSNIMQKVWGISKDNSIVQNLKAITDRLKILTKVIIGLIAFEVLGKLIIILGNLTLILGGLAKVAFFSKFVAFASNPFILGLAAVISAIVIAFKSLKAAYDPMKKINKRFKKLNTLVKQHSILQKELFLLLKKGIPGTTQTKQYIEMAKQTQILSAKIKDLRTELGLLRKVKPFEFTAPFKDRKIEDFRKKFTKERKKSPFEEAFKVQQKEPNIEFLRFQEQKVLRLNKAIQVLTTDTLPKIPRKVIDVNNLIDAGNLLKTITKVSTKVLADLSQSFSNIFLNILESGGKIEEATLERNQRVADIEAQFDIDRQRLQDDFNSGRIKSAQTLADRLVELERSKNDAIADADKDLEAAKKEHGISLVKIIQDMWTSITKTIFNMVSKIIGRLMALFVIQQLVGFGAGLAGSTSALGRGLNTLNKALKAQPLVQLATGTMDVPKDMTANIHQGEIVVPKKFSNDIRSGKSTLGNNKETNSLLGGVLNKLDNIATLAKEKGTLIIQDEEIRVLTKAINNENFRLGFTGT